MKTRSPTLLLQEVGRLSSLLCQKTTGGLPITYFQFTVLLAISEHPGLSLRLLARLCNTNTATAVSLLQVLVRKGFARRSDDPRRDLTMTDLGQRVISQSLLFLPKLDAQILDQLPRAGPSIIEALPLVIAKLDWRALREHRGPVKRRRANRESPPS